MDEDESESLSISQTSDVTSQNSEETDNNEEITELSEEWAYEP